MGARLRVVGPPALIPAECARLGVEVFHDMRAGLDGADVVMMLRLQKERMTAASSPPRASISASMGSTRRSWPRRSRTPSSCIPAR
jgi:aspartate carbamoyltransferase catalytic subunit